MASPSSASRGISPAEGPGEAAPPLRQERGQEKRTTLAAAPGPPMDLAVVIPARNERENLEVLLPALREVIAGLEIAAGIVVVDGGSHDGTREAAAWCSKW